LKRAVIDGFALPLGITPGPIKVPTPGYTVGFSSGRNDEPDTYSFYVAVSHEHVSPIARRAMELLPETVYGIVEISSGDAYRPIDVYIGQEEVPLRRFLTTWRQVEPILMEDASIGRCRIDPRQLRPGGGRPDLAGRRRQPRARAVADSAGAGRIGGGGAGHR
jgi:hypothetical protein